MPDDFRCSLASEYASEYASEGLGAEEPGEPIEGTAPTETDWLLVEQPGPWAAKATGHLSHLVGAHGRAQLIRRHGGSSGPGTRVFRATLGSQGAAPVVTTAVVDDVAEIESLTAADYTPYAGPLWLVCTNGRRDVCCAERGRPVAAALAGRWPEATWETTHLGGHRFAATLLALPTGMTLGRLDPASAVEACESLECGRLELAVVRGRAGQPPAAQAAELHLRGAHGWTALDDVAPVSTSDDTVTLRTPDGLTVVTMRQAVGAPRRQSCAADKLKAAATWRFVSSVPG